MDQFAAIVTELVGNQAMHLGTGRRAGSGRLDPLGVDRLALAQDVQPDVAVKPHEVGLQQLGYLLTELGHRGVSDLEQALDV